MNNITRVIAIAVSLAMVISSCNLGAEHVNKGMNYYAQGDYINAKEQLLKAEGQSLGYYSKKEYLTILGNACKELEQYEEAIVYHKKAIVIDPNFADAYVNLGIVYRLTGKFELAMETYSRASTINPNDAALHASMGSLYLYMDKPQIGIEHLERAIEINSNLVVAHSNISLALAHVGDFDRSAQELAIAETMGYKNGDLIRERIKMIRDAQ